MSTPVTPDAISEWLDKYSRSRDWLADQTGASPTTVAGWLAKGKPRPIPLPTLKLIERLMCDDLLGETQYSLDEALLIRQAMVMERYANLRDFQRDAVLAQARTIARFPHTPNLDMLRPGFDEGDGMAAFPAKPHLQAAAGSPILSDVTDWDGADNTVLVRINGLSMEPQLHDGEVITMRHKRASRSPWMKKGLIYLVEYDGGFTVKRYNTRRAFPDEIGEDWAEDGKVKVLESLNPAFPEIIIKQPVEWVAWLDSTIKA